MANELLDFVMSVIRDPAVAARYAADPERAIADAHLSGVTSADVNHLLPVVSDSLGAAGDAGGSVWTGGAATAAFDAFTPQPAVSPSIAHHPVIDAALPHADRTVGAETVPDHYLADPGFADASQLSTYEPAPEAVVDPLHQDLPVWAGWEHSDTHSPDSHLGIDHGNPGYEPLD
jgi:hypothetical protein